MVTTATDAAPRLLVEEPDFRLVEVCRAGNVFHVLEVRDGIDAMGAERWREFKVENPHLRQIFGYLVRIVTKGQ